MKLKDVVVVHDDELRAGTWLIAQGFEREHKEVIKLVKKYSTRFEKLGDLSPHIYRPNPGAGPPVKEYLLNEPQTSFLGTLFKNQNDTVVDFKLSLVQEFYRMREVLENIKAQHKDIKWLETRKKGKALRLDSTDSIKEFETYATEQGSQNANWYYISLTKMLNGLLFIVDGKFKNLRDMMTSRQLMIVSGADLVIEKALTDGMKKQIHYKEIYRLAKERVEIFAELHGQSEILSQQLILFKSTKRSVCHDS